MVLVQMAGIQSLIESGRVLIRAVSLTIRSPSIKEVSIKPLYLQLESQLPMRWIISSEVVMKFVGYQSLKSIPFLRQTLAANRFVVFVEAKVFLKF